MPQITADQLDDLLETVDAFMDNGDDFRPPEDQDIPHDARVRFLTELNDLLAQDTGQAGSHAYDMLAAVEEINTGNARTLIELVAATVMAKARQAMEDGALDEKATELSVTFQPSDIDDMQRAYDMRAERKGMLLTVTLIRKAERTESWQEAPEGAEGSEPLPQAEIEPERPVWAVRTLDTLWGYPSRAEAEKALRHKALVTDDVLAHIENRFCLHPDCPSTRCNHPEATSNG